MSGAARARQTGFDCSGLVVWAYGLAGVVVPRVANDQWHAEPHVAMDQLVPGDLVFFGTGDYADHVGIYVGGSAMVDAPYTGADVRIDTIPMTVGAAWGSQVVLGAADPVSQSGGHLMATSKPVHEADALATIIPFRPRRSTMAPHPSVRSSRACSVRGDRRSLPARPHPTPRAALVLRDQPQPMKRASPMNQSQSQTPFDGTFLVFLVVVGFVIGEGVATDLAGQLASLAFGAHHVVPGGIGAGATVFLRLWGHLGDPKLAWGPRARALLPGPVAMWTALAVTELLLVATAVVAFRLVRRAQRSFGGLRGGAAKVGRAEVERRMGRKAVERHTAALYGDARCRQA